MLGEATDVAKSGVAGLVAPGGATQLDMLKPGGARPNVEQITCRENQPIRRNHARERVLPPMTRAA